MTDVYKATIKLSSQCECTVIDEITGEDKETDECFGCNQDNLDLLRSEVIEPWIKINNLGGQSAFRFSVVGLTWENRSGSGRVELSQLLSGRFATLSNGDYTIYWAVKGTKLTAVRYSHDEPTGAQYHFKPTLIVVDSEPACPVCHRNTGHDCELGKEF